MPSLGPLLELLPDGELNEILGIEGALTVPEAARPYLIAAVVRRTAAPVLVITARIEDAEHLTRDLQAFLGRDGAEVFPGWEVLPGEPMSPSVETMGRRLDVIARLQRGEPVAVVATAQSATQLVAPPSAGLDVIEIRNGDTLDLDAMSERLVEMGYERNYT